MNLFLGGLTIVFFILWLKARKSKPLYEKKLKEKVEEFNGLTKELHFVRFESRKTGKNT